MRIFKKTFYYGLLLLTAVLMLFGALTAIGIVLKYLNPYHFIWVGVIIAFFIAFCFQVMARLLDTALRL